MKKLDYKTAKRILREAFKKYNGKVELEFNCRENTPDHKITALEWIYKHEEFKSGICIAYVTEYLLGKKTSTTCVSANRLYTKTDNLLAVYNPNIVGFEVLSETSSTLDEEFKDKIEQTMQIVLDANKEMNMSASERDFNIARQIIQCQYSIESKKHWIIIGVNRYHTRNTGDRSICLRKYPDDSIGLELFDGTKTRIFYGDKAKELNAMYHYRQCQLRLMVESNKVIG